MRLSRKEAAEAWQVQPVVPGYSLNERGRMAHIALGFSDEEEAGQFLQRALAIYEQNRDRELFLLALCNLVEGLEAPVFRQVAFRESLRASIAKGLDELEQGERREWNSDAFEAFKARMRKRWEREQKRKND